MTAQTLKFRTLIARRDGQAALDRAAAAIFQLFLARETEFGVNPAVVIDYPDIADPATSSFLTDPLAYIASRRVALGVPNGRCVILTTYADRIGEALAAAGYRKTPIDMPAGPDFTASFEIGAEAAGERTLYIEAVNEADAKIRPSFALELVDEAGALRGGACGSIHDRAGARYAYLATMTLDRGLPPGEGKNLAAALFEFLAGEGVKIVHLGTQTAGPFYEKLGFRVTTTVLKKLRRRETAQGEAVFSDLVMMERRLDQASGAISETLGK